MPATQIEKMTALAGRDERVKLAHGRLSSLIYKVRHALMDADIGPTLTAQDKQALLARYNILRAAVFEAVELYPEDLAPWEPDPSEYEVEEE